MIPTGLEEWGTILERTTVAPSVKITGSVAPVEKEDAFGEPFRKSLVPAPGSHLLGKAVRHQGKAATVRFMLDSDTYGHGSVLQYADHSWGWCERDDLDDLEIM